MSDRLLYPRSGFLTRAIIAPLLLACLLLLPAIARAAEVIPPVPARYFNDYTGKVDSGTADALNTKLEQFERDTSNQIVVAVYPKMQSESDIADYTFRVKETWHVGQKGKNNGAVLFVFMDDHKLFIQVNYGLEGALPDATCKQIIDQEITPHFKTGDYAGGLSAGVDAMLAATRGEYKGNGNTADSSSGNNLKPVIYFAGSLVGAFILLGLFLLFVNFFGGRFYQRHVRGLSFMENAYLGFLRAGASMVFSGSSSSSRGGGSWGGSSGGGGFSGGGGTGGGGGAGGSW